MRSIFGGGRAVFHGVAVLAAALGWSAGMARGDQILETWNNSLTSYLPAAASGGQKVWPLHQQRGVNLDGSRRTWSALGWAFAGNPTNAGGAESWNGNLMLGDMRVDLGAYSPTDVDISLPSNGFRWIIGRTFNGVQLDTTALPSPAHFDSNGAQGLNWYQISQPELMRVLGATSADDSVYIIFGADRYIEFQRTGSSSTEYKGKNGAAGVVHYTAGSPHVWTYTDQHGNVTDFFGDNTASDRADWQIWRMTDPAGNVCYVGDASSASTAVTSGYNADKTIAVAYDAATTAGGGGHRFTYTYTTIDSVSRLTQVKAEIKAGGTWASPTSPSTVAQVDYAYYQTGDNTYGADGNLKLVTITTPLTDSGVNLVQKKLYRYYKGTYNGSTNPGHLNSIQMVVGYEGYRKYDWDQDSNLDDDPQTASTANLKSYCDAYFEYPNNSNVGDYKISEAFFNGECGCSGGNNGAYEFTYGTNGSYTNNAGYDAAWCTRTIIKRPDVTYETRYFDEVGQPIDKVITDIDPSSVSPKIWATGIVRNSDGQIIELRTPANITGYTHSTGTFAPDTSVGLIHLYTRIGLSSPNDTFNGFVEYRKHKIAGTTGNSAAQYQDSRTEYITASPPAMTIGSTVITRPIVKATTVYEDESTVPSVARQTATTISAHPSGGSLMLKTTERNNPVVGSSENGSNSPTVAQQFLRADGTSAFSITPETIYTYTQHSNGLLVKRIDDANPSTTANFGSGDDPAANFGVSSPANIGIDNTTTYTYDNQGRSTSVTMPDGRVTQTYYSKLADGRMVTVQCPRVVSTTFYGPMSYSVSNLAGRSEREGTIAITSSGITTALTGWIDETDADPITAVDIGSLARLTVHINNSPGTREEQTRAYHTIPASGAGSSGTNYDATTYGYDDMGRKWRVKQASGTIARSVYDTLGRTIESWVGTNDNSFAGGESSGPDTMTKTSETQYDGSAGSQKGNSYVTKRILDADGDWTVNTDQRETTFYPDARGRVVAVVNPVAPHSVSAFDNLGRVIKTAQYSSNSGLSASSVPTSTTNRVEYSETEYDGRGQVWHTRRHKIDASTGASGDSLDSYSWYDPNGRLIKSRSPGGLTKTRYDRLGRTTHRWTLAKDNDTLYSHVYNGTKTDVTGDIVLEESQTTYENSSGNVLMQATISRFHDDLGAGTTGELDQNDSGDTDRMKYTAADVKGRIQITASWYDALDRVTATASLGTNGSGNVSTYDRAGVGAVSAPSPSDTELVTSYTYNDDGTVLDVTDPRGKVSRTLYDQMGRTVAKISNYVNGTPSGATGDDDNYVRYVFANGLQTQMWVDLDGDNVQDADDQVTTYTYGTPKGTGAGDSNIATGHLLYKTTYPDSTSGTDLVTYAYNAQSQTMWVKDQAGGIVQTDYDLGGRQTYRRVTTLASGFDGAVRRIGTTYTSRGQTQLVTQYDNAAVGSGSVVDEVKYTYDDWGNITSFEQDRDSTVGGGGNQYTVGYTWAKATPSGGHDTLRCTGMTLPGSGDTSTITYTYDSASNVLDDAASRVSKLQTGGSPTTRATYKYLGASRLVGTDVIEPDVYSRLYGSGTANYDAMDRFGRTTVSRWTKNLSPARNFYDVALTYDRDSNITSVDDAVLPGFDAAYSMDGRNRLSRAEEGTLSTGSITGRTRDQQWTLSQPGNWARNKLDLDGDSTFTGGGELDDTGTFNTVNELTARDIDTSGGNDYTLTYDAVGNLTNDGEDFKYVYDAFGRLVTVKTLANAVVAEYTYNGLNNRKSWHYDTDVDGDVDGSDKTYRFAYDTRWRMVATFRDSDTDPKERFVWHNAGMNGRGGSSYIDSAVLRDRDMTNGWTGSADGTLEERHYYCQNWRADVSVTLKYENSVWRVAEWIKYSAYGVPFAVTPADYDGSGFVDIVDTSDWTTDYNGGAGAWSPRLDLNLDGSLTSTDSTIYTSEFGGGEAGGRFVLSRDSVANRLGYAGYQYDPAFVGAERAIFHVRYRVYDAGAGMWTRRDPIPRASWPDLFAYAHNGPVVRVDSMGLKASNAVGCEYESQSTRCQLLCNAAEACGVTESNHQFCCVCDLYCADTLSTPVFPVADPIAWDIFLGCTDEHEMCHMNTPLSYSLDCGEAMCYDIGINCLLDSLDQCWKSTNPFACQTQLLEEIGFQLTQYENYKSTCGSNVYFAGTGRVNTGAIIAGHRKCRRR